MRTGPITRTNGGERGVALIITMMIMALMSALLIGFTTAVSTDQRYRTVEKDRIRAFYAAQSGLEKLSADIVGRFAGKNELTADDLTALSTTPPEIADVKFALPDSGLAYGATAVPPQPGEDGWDQISSGPYQGLIALKKEYDLESAVRTVAGGEAHLRRRIETVLIPVFQFGIFSDLDLGFHAGPNFKFGGRVHTNGNLFLAHGDSNTLELPEKVTVVKEVIRKYLVNGRRIQDTDHEGFIRMARAPGAFRNMLDSEGSLKETIGSGKNEPTWTNTSLSTYNGYIRNGRTGAKELKLPITTPSVGGSNVDIIRRPNEGETRTPQGALLYGERYFSKVSLRILLSDTANDILKLPTVTQTPPVALDETWVPPMGQPAIARSPGPFGNKTNGNTALNAASINLDLVPAEFGPGGAGNNLTYRPMIGGVLGAPVAITCSGRTITAPIRFTGCLNVVAGELGSTVTAQVDGVGLTATATAAVAGGAVEVRVDTVDRFATELYWVGNAMVTCRGNTPASLLDCTGTPAVADDTPVGTFATTPVGTSTIGGFIKIEMANAAGEWSDVTAEILNHGIADQNQQAKDPANGNNVGRMCADPTPNAIIRLQRLRDNVEAGAGACSYDVSLKPTDYWPNVLFDGREGLQRNTNPGAANAAAASIMLGGVMHYVALDVLNLSRWIRGEGVYAGQSGTAARSTNGYSVYFSDRRNNRNESNEETGEYGNEDVINGGTANGAPNRAADDGENVNASAPPKTVLDEYGKSPTDGLGAFNQVIANSVGPLDAGADPFDPVRRGHAQVNRAVLFRRALKVVNGGTGIVAPGLTIASENPVYIQGDWNAQADFSGAHVATSFLADALTVLSNDWRDSNSFTWPYCLGVNAAAGCPTARPGRSANSWYRFAVIAGVNKPFQRANVVDAVALAPNDFGSDGGVHNFLRMLESGGGTVNYLGSIAMFFYSRQAVGVYKTAVYGAPARNFKFDIDFLNPALLPPLTPAFRDINALGFTQELRPGR